MNITTVNRPMLEELLALTAPGEADDEPVEVTLRRMDDGPEGPGLYAYYTEYPEEGVTLIDGKSEVLRAEGRASLTGAQPAPAAPSDGKWVPLEPTDEMKLAGQQYARDTADRAKGLWWWGRLYQAMLAAAPAAQPADSAMEDALEELADEVARVLPILARAEDSGLWSELTVGTGVATTNALVHRLRLARALTAASKTENK